ncbi:hypothetical protein [Streptomyces niveus]|uniref:hypothetical protein n=1 Tax=Streptomyces niveus TaxID=193462 RepID=UPI0036D3C95F
MSETSDRISWPSGWDLAAQGLLHPVAEFKGHPIRRRHAWIETSVTTQAAATLLGWPAGKFEVTAERRGLSAGALGRFPRTAVEGLRE